MTGRISITTYVEVYVALMVLLLATALLAGVHLAYWSIVIALGIAAIKAILVILYFMHIRVSRGATIIFSAAGFVWLGILMTLSLSDLISRNYLHIPGK